MRTSLQVKGALSLISIVLCGFFCPSKAVCADVSFGYQQVIDEARQLGAHPYQAPKDQLPDFLKNLTYDQWRDIRYKDSATLWPQGPFELRFFHPGFFYHLPVEIYYVDENGAHPFLFSPSLFDYGKNDFKEKVPPGLGFAGFRIHYPMNKADYADEVAVFLGASYFRAVAQGQMYGASARGLAINTATDSGEEFPSFNKFWIVKPGRGESQITVYALLDSDRVAGAYRYIIHPGRETVMEVSSTLFIRKKIKKLGIGPMTSMFLYGENSSRKDNEDFRPEVHDSDGLLIVSSTGEWIWRPLIDPPDLLVNTFEVKTPKAFGLFQRDVNFDHYQDLEARPELRPSLWLTPHQDWGAGHVELIQIPTNSEHNDNINAFWVPQKQPEAGQTLKFEYTLEWCQASMKDSFRGIVTQTRIERLPDQKGALFVIDFDGHELQSLPASSAIDVDLNVTKGCTVVERQVFKNAVTGGWRLVFQIKIDGEGFIKDMVPSQKTAVGLRAFLKKDSRPLSETWDYAYIP